MRRNICDRLQQQQSKMNRNIVKRNTAKKRKEKTKYYIKAASENIDKNSSHSICARRPWRFHRNKKKKHKIKKKKNTKKKYTQNSHNAPTLKANKKQQHIIIMKLICQKKREREIK